MIENFAPKWLEDNQTERIAQAFRAKHPRYAAIPVDIEGMVEFDLEINIIPIPALKELSKRLGLDIDAFISADFSSISIDEFIMMQRRARYRFSLAHEIGHMVLHEAVYENFRFSLASEWIELILGVTEKWGPFEYQANEFAGRLLVPQNELLQRYAAAEEEAAVRVLEELPGLDVDEPALYDDGLRWATTQLLANIFDVSRESMEKRLVKEKLIILDND